MEAFGPYFTAKHETFWGKAINYDDADCDPVREWVLQSAEGWIRDLGIDGLRLDAIHAIYDDSARPIVAEIAARAHAAGGATRAHRPLVIAESGLNDPKVIRPPEQGGWDCDAQWADDFHHAIRVLLTGEREGYYADFGTLEQVAKAFQRPFVHDGDFSPLRRRRFGAPADDRDPRQFVIFTANHDQVGNRALGDRLPRELRPLAAFCVLLAPFTPMLFMGEEYGEDAPFQFFSDHIDPEIATATRRGRRREFAAFAAFSGEEVPDPQAVETFERSKLTRRGGPAARRALPRPAAAAARARPGGRRVDRARPARRLPAGRARRAHAAGKLRRRAGEPAGRRERAAARDRSRDDAARRRRRTAPAVRSAAAMSDYEMWLGEPFPLGATWDGDGVNFALFSQNAQRVQLCLFDDEGTETRLALEHRRRSTGTATCRGSAPGSATATASTGPTSPRPATASTPPSC